MFSSFWGSDLKSDLKLEIRDFTNPEELHGLFSYSEYITNLKSFFIFYILMRNWRFLISDFSRSAVLFKCI